MVQFKVVEEGETKQFRSLVTPDLGVHLLPKDGLLNRVYLVTETYHNTVRSSPLYCCVVVSIIL